MLPVERDHAHMHTHRTDGGETQDELYRLGMTTHTCKEIREGCHDEDHDSQFGFATDRWVGPSVSFFPASLISLVDMCVSFSAQKLHIHYVLMTDVL